MKLNYKQTILVGLAFFAICAFWNMYDGLIPLILRDSFHLGDTISGFIMSADNILALILLPVFGALSDRAGRRMPFIVWGTVGAVALTVALPFSISAGSFPLFIILLGLLLLAMSVYRSPAVALMPDVTPKPLRSKGNAVINLMGALGGVFTLVTIGLFSRLPIGQRPDYLPVFLSVAALMLISMLVLRATVNEGKLVQRMRDINYGEPEEAASAAAPAAADAESPASVAEGDSAPHARLSPPVRRSLLLILASVALWFMGYNAITTAFTKYATAVWGHDLSQAATCLLIATVGAVVSYIPIGALASRIGRKRTILIGVALLAACFGLCAFIASEFSPALYALFLIVGFAWASINVNSYPMVVEISQHGDIGKYTGYYYTFSMAAQIATPILSGALLEHVGYHTLFPYAALMVAASFVTMLLTKHGDNKPKMAASKLEAFDVDD